APRCAKRPVRGPGEGWRNRNSRRHRLRLSHIVFFQYPGGDRGLHSFPTRRSSDLGAPHGGVGSHLLATRDRLRDSGGGAFSTFQDRKSTRLNSSHVAISYAVFCLKKKNERYAMAGVEPIIGEEQRGFVVTLAAPVT